MDISDRGGHYRSIRMLLAGGSALATVMVLGTQAANALTATAEELAALGGATVTISSTPAVSASLVWAAPAAHDAASINCGEIAAADGWAVGRYQELAAVGSAEAATDSEAAPQVTYNQLALLGEPEPAEKLAESHAVANAAPEAGEPDGIVETPRAQRVREFEELAAVDSAELDNMRGGFSMGGLVVRFGFELKNVLNGFVVNEISTINPAVFSGGGLSNQGQFHFVEKDQAGNVTSDTTGGLPTGLIVNRSFNAGQTNMQFSINNGVMSLVQNSANNQTIQSQANLNLNISGLTSSLRSALGSMRTMDAIRTGNRFRR